MESGLEDRNNNFNINIAIRQVNVSMESGLEDRNNRYWSPNTRRRCCRLNGVRPRRPEQCPYGVVRDVRFTVSMESGLEDRNNHEGPRACHRGL